jgi:tight adherence protein B
VTYTVIGLVAWSGRRRERAESAALDAMLDVLARLAAELRAGADPRATVGAAVAPFAGGGDAGGLARRATAAVRVADITGAPLADLLDRLDDDARALVRRRRTAIAQASGALATALLLAALPLAGIGLGYAIGVDPGHVLLHTPIGAACASGALAAQIAGLAWSHRITRAIGRAA